MRRSEPCSTQARACGSLPFDPSAAAIQPETPARVVRVQAGAKGSYYVGLHLELPAREPPRPAEDERRGSARFSFALPIFVRPRSPWPEESMTHNVSHNGVRFETTHIYTAGDTVLAKIPWGEWANTGEIAGRVVRVECPAEAPATSNGAAQPSAEDPTLTSVAVEWMSAE